MSSHPKLLMDSRTKILNAASELFLKGGVGALSVRAISKSAGLSTIGIYSHFQGKQGILDTLYIEGFNLVYDAMDVPLKGKVGVDDVMRGCQAYLRVAVDYEAHYRLIFGESDANYMPSREARAAGDRAFGKLLSNTGDFLDDTGRSTDKMDASMGIWAVMHGYISISHHFRASQGLDWNKMALRAVRIYLDACP